MFKLSATSLQSWSEDSSFENLALTESPDATTISSTSNRSSMVTAFEHIDEKTQVGSRRAHAQQVIIDTDPKGHDDFVALQRELARFASKPKIKKGNILRVSLLAFLRKRQCELLPQGPELSFRISVLESWWIQLANYLKERDTVSGADRAAYLEAISGLVARPEWRFSDRFPTLLLETVAWTLNKIGLPNLPVTLGAYAGKLLAYAYFYCPGIAPVLLFHLRVHQVNVNKLKIMSHIESEPPLESFAECFPMHVRQLVGLATVPQQPPPSPLKEVPGPWIRNWNPATSVFASFIKHYYSLIADMLPPEADTWNHAHLAAPGLLIIQGAIVQHLKHMVQASAVVRGRERTPKTFTVSSPSSPASSPLSSPASSPLSSPANSPPRSPTESPERTKDLGPLPRTPAPSQIPESFASADIAAPVPRGNRQDVGLRVDRLRIFAALREILHNDENCLPYFRVFCLQFDRMIQTVASGINVYHMNACVKLCDFVEEWLNCVTLHHRRSQVLAIASLASAVDWEFWVHVAGRMITSENCHTEIRALSFLFNIWPNLPQQISRDQSSGSAHLLNPSLLRAGVAPAGLEFTPKSENLLWDVTEWLLAPEMWDRYFCHWSPLVRSYFQRLICFRVTFVGGAGKDWICDFDIGRYHEEASNLVRSRLASAYSHCSGLAVHSSMMPATTPSCPVPNRQLCVGVNAAAAQPEPHRVYLFDIFDNSAYYANNRGAKGAQQGLLAPEIDIETPSVSSCSSSCVSPPLDDTSSVSTQSVSGDRSLKRSGSLASIASSCKNTLSRAQSFASLKDAAQPENDTQPASPPKSPSSKQNSSKGWKLLKKLLPSPSSEKEPLPTDTKPVETGRKKMRSKHSNRFTDGGDIPVPWQLSEPCPEVQRPLFRFNLTNVRDSAYQCCNEAALAIPFMPFDSEIRAPIGRPGHSGRCEQDLVYWNYGCRALAEWNIVVTMFEEFIESQRGAFSNVDTLAMPFMVAEIPWRVVG